MLNEVAVPYGMEGANVMDLIGTPDHSRDT
jgi:hypothetical protein